MRHLSRTAACGSLSALCFVSVAVAVVGAQAPAPSVGVIAAATPTMASPADSTPTPAPTRSRRPVPRSPVTRKRVPPPAPTPPTPASSATEALLREYEIRLNAHRRELLQREAELEAAKRQITTLRQSPPRDTRRDAQALEPERTGNAAGEEVARLRERTRALEEQLRSVAAAPPTPSLDPTEPGDKALIASLQHEIDEERENRATLETEIRRLSSEARSTDQLPVLSQSLDGARAEILVLNHRLAEEQHAREALEVTIERVRQTADVAPGDDWLDRFQATMNERREQAERLQEELHKANEAIIALKGKLESAGRQASGGPATANLEGEVTKLKEALATAQQANADLHAQAELASRLAELLYGQSR